MINSPSLHHTGKPEIRVAMKKTLRSSKVGHRIKVFVTKFDNLSSIPQICMVEREN